MPDTVLTLSTHIIEEEHDQHRMNDFCAQHLLFDFYHHPWGTYYSSNFWDIDLECLWSRRGMKLGGTTPELVLFVTVFQPHIQPIEGGNAVHFEVARGRE